MVAMYSDSPCGFAHRLDKHQLKVRGGTIDPPTQGETHIGITKTPSTSD